jgi:TRAP-type transport system small permease protein
MGKIVDLVSVNFFRALEFIMVLMMVGMLVLVGFNVLLRIGFNSGIDFADEIPRFMFLWLTFCGAVVAMKQRTHINVNMFVQMAPRHLQIAFFIITQVLVAVCGAYIAYGTWMLHDVIADNASPVLQISTLWVYGVTYISGTGLLLVALANLARLMMGRVGDEELAEAHQGADDEVSAHAQEARP